MEDRLAELQKIQAANPVVEEVPAAPAPKTGKKGEKTKTQDMELKDLEEGKLKAQQQQQQQQEDPLKDFFIKIDELNDRLQRMRILMKHVEENHASTLKATTTQQTQENNKEMEQLIREINKEVQAVKEGLALLDAENKQIRKEKGSIAEVRIREGQHAQISRNFIEILKTFQAMQSEQKTKYTERVARQVRIVKPSITEEELERILQSGTDEIFKSEMLNSSHASAKAAYMEVVEKHRDILMIEKSLEELFELFTDLAYMIDEQQEIIDNIQHNIQQANNYVEKAIDEISKARSYQKKSRKKIMFLIALFMIFAMIVVVAVVVVPLVLKFRRIIP